MSQHSRASHRWSSFTRMGVCVLALAWATPAHAGLLELTAELHGGVGGGKGLSGDYKDSAFHEGAQGPTYGFLAGVEILWVDVWVEHNQYLDNSDIAGTWTQFMVGMDLEYEFTEEGVRRVRTYDKQTGQTKEKRQRYERKSGGYVEMGGGFGFGVGTGQQVELPLDNAQVTDKGILFQVSIGGGWRLNRFFSFGVSVPVQMGFLFKSGRGTIDDASTRYQSVQAAALANLRLTIDLM